MKVSIQVALFLIGIFYSGQAFGQSANFYLDKKGNIKDEQSHVEQKARALEAMQAVSADMDIYEELNLEYERNDSIVYSYKWHFTDDDVEAVRLEIESKKALIGKEYPIKDAKTLDGRVIDIDDLKGKPTLINLWFTSCGPCIKEMPALNKMQADHSDRFNFLAITFESKSKVKKFLQRIDFDFEQIVNSDELTTDLGFEGYPLNLFLDKDGVLRVIEGNIPDKKNESGEREAGDGAEFIAILEKML